MTALIKIRLISIVVGCGFISAILWAAYQTHFHSGYPYDTFLFDPSDRFMDFFNSYNFLSAFTYINQNLAYYFPFTYWSFYPLSLLRSQWAFITFNLLFFAYTYYFMHSLTKNIRETLNKLEYQQFIITIIFLSYPFIYCLDRGNLEIIVFIFLSYSVYLFSQKKYAFSAIFLAFATGIKFYPIIFALLFIKKKRYNELALFLLITGIITIAALASLKGGFSENLNVLLRNTIAVSNESFLMGGVRQSASLMAAFKVLYVQIYSMSHVVTYSQFVSFVHWFSPLYSIGAFMAIFLCSIYIILFEHVLWKQVMILTLLMILLPAVSFDYKLIHLMIPLALFLHEDSLDKSRFNVLYVIMFSILLVPKNYYMVQLNIHDFSGSSTDLIVSISNLINILVMIVFMLFIIRSGIKARIKKNFSCFKTI